LPAQHRGSLTKRAVDARRLPASRVAFSTGRVRHREDGWVLKLPAIRGLAIAIGALLPLAELVRRAGDLASWWLWIDDFVIGGALLAGAWASRHASERGVRALAGAWGVAAGMGYYSLVGHVLRLGGTDVSGMPQWVITLVIALGWLLVLLALVSTIRLAGKSP
jgi:hypothetical protein